MVASAIAAGGEELHRASTDGRAPMVVDVHSRTSRRLDRPIVPGALLLEFDRVDEALRDVPLDQELVIYCNCPNEASSASAAKVLMARGYRHVRPLQGGLDAWGAAGYAERGDREGLRRLLAGDDARGCLDGWVV